MLMYWTTAKPSTVIMAARQNADEMKNAADRQMIDRQTFIAASCSPNRYVMLLPNHIDTDDRQSATARFENRQRYTAFV